MRGRMHIREETMNKTIIASLIGLAFTPVAYSAENINLDDVLVTATRSAQPKEAVIADVTVIERDEIERAGGSSLTNLLSRQAGVQINSSGGAGTISSVFLRGTGSEQLVVLVDGLRINSATLGTTAFQNIPLGQVERIEILRGPASSLYGADAVGGVIQIFTRKAQKGKPLIHAALGLGSYDTVTAEAGISAGNDNTQYGLNISSHDTNSFSAIRSRTPNVQDRDNDAYNNLSFSGHLNHQFTKGQSIGLQVFQSKGHSHSDDSFSNGGGDFDNIGNQTLQSYSVSSKNQLAENWHSTLKPRKLSSLGSMTSSYQ